MWGMAWNFNNSTITLATQLRLIHGETRWSPAYFGIMSEFEYAIWHTHLAGKHLINRPCSMYSSLLTSLFNLHSLARSDDSWNWLCDSKPCIDWIGCLLRLNRKLSAQISAVIFNEICQKMVFIYFTHISN